MTDPQDHNLPPTSEAAAEVARLEAELRRWKREADFLRGVIEHSGDVIVTTDEDGHITEWGGRADTILGWSREEILGKSAAILYVDPEEGRAIMQQVRETGRPTHQEVAIRRQDGDHILMELTVSALLEDEEFAGTIGIGRDITRRKELEEKLRRLSITDGLTGLYNQIHFYEQLEIEKERALRLSHPLSLVLFDLDKFKEYNDSEGHTVGDDALRQVARVVFRSIRKEVDSGYRYGGDEFTVLLPGASADTALIFAERLRKGIEVLNIGEIRASIGVSQFQPDDPRRQLVVEADEAMYWAKNQGGNQACAWRPEMALD